MLTREPTQRSKTTSATFNQALFENQIKQLSEECAKKFQGMTKTHALFHMVYLFLGSVEVLALLLFFPFFAKSSVLAFTLAAFFLTGFSYLVLRFYNQTKKPEQFFQLKEAFVQSIETILPFNKESGEYRHFLTTAIYQLITRLEGREYHYYILPHLLDAFKPLMEKLSLWCHFQDVHQMKELLHRFCIGIRIEGIKSAPTHVEAHILLAQSYIALYKLYLDPRKSGRRVPYPFLLSEYTSPESQVKLKQIAHRAMEELKIVDAYAPSDPWVHAQMALVYHDLDEIEHEIAEYELLTRISPSDGNLRYRLGVLYFQMGKPSLGLKIYEELKSASDPRADGLITQYTQY